MDDQILTELQTIAQLLRFIAGMFFAYAGMRFLTEG